MVLMCVAFLMLPIIGLGFWLAEHYRLGDFFTPILVLSSASLVGFSVVGLASQKEKFRCRGLATVQIIDGKRLVIDKNKQHIDIPITAIRSYTVRRDRNKFNSKQTLQWVIRYLPRKKLVLCASSDDPYNNDHYSALSSAHQAVGHALNGLRNGEMYKKPNFVESKLAWVMAWLLAFGFIVFAVVGVYLTGRFNLGILLLTVMGFVTPLMGLQMVREVIGNNVYTLCNSTPTFGQAQ